jgi:hypothetical protein
MRRGRPGDPFQIVAVIRQRVPVPVFHRTVYEQASLIGGGRFRLACGREREFATTSLEYVLLQRRHAEKFAKPCKHCYRTEAT